MIHLHTHGTELVLCAIAEAIVVPATIAAIVAYVRVVLHPDTTTDREVTDE